MVSVPNLAIQRRRITVQGIVQGVGFRPFVYGQAYRRSLAGFVLADGYRLGDDQAFLLYERCRSRAAPIA